MCHRRSANVQSENDPDSPSGMKLSLRQSTRTPPSHPSPPHPTIDRPTNSQSFTLHTAPAHDGIPRRLHHPGDPVENRFRGSSIQKKPPRPTHNVLTTRHATRRAVDHGGLATRTIGQRRRRQVGGRDETPAGSLPDQHGISRVVAQIRDGPR